MAFLTILSTIVVCVFLSMQAANGVDNNFYSYYSPLWGLNHLTVNPQGSNVQLLMDKSSGAGFRSKLDYGSGLFHIKMKIPDKKTGGIVTSFYLTSQSNFKPMGKHFELDFEFLGTNGTLQTNVYDYDDGHREQSFKLWFDPSQDFHTYEILWNFQQIVFFVDNIPIRTFKNNKAKGVNYPSTAMHLEASIWNADWAGEVDWTKAPFIAQYQDFHFDACRAQANGPIIQCSDAASYYWNHWKLSPQQKRTMNYYRKKYMTYDYCANKAT